MKRKFYQTAVSIFVTNRLGWILVVWNLLMFFFFIKFREGGLNNPAIFGCVAGKIELVKIYNPHFGSFGEFFDLGFLLINLLNLPALFSSNIISDILFSAYPQCYLTEGNIWSYSSYYVARIWLSIFFIIIQWLLVAAIAKKLIKLVKDS